MFNGGITPQELDKQDYMELLEILAAKSREDRPKPAAEAHANIAKMFNQ